MLLVEEEMVAARWRRHRAELLEGHEIKWSELATIARAHEKQDAGRGRMNLVTLHDVATALGKRTPRKATGPSGISISVWQAGGESSVRILAALLDISRALGRSAVGRRGGRVQELYKNNGDRNETKSHRGILVQDLLGTIQASFLKKEIEEHNMKFIPDTQCGCARGKGTCLAGQIVELAADSSKGFIVADSTYDMARMRSELKALSISDEVCEQIISEAATEKNLIRRAGTSSQLGDLIGDMHTATWIVCSNKMPSNDDSVLWTKRGSRQGCPPGGIAFNLMYEQVLRKVRAAGEESGIWTRIGYHPAQQMWSVSREAEERRGPTVATGKTPCWRMSRLLVTLVFPSKQTTRLLWCAEATEVLQIVDEVCEAHGLGVNMNDGETEVTIEMKGEGARKQFQTPWDESEKSHRISTGTGRSARNVSRYKTRSRNKTQNPIDDAQAKANSALTTYHQLAHSAFRTPHIATHFRAQLACFLVHITSEIWSRHLATDGAPCHCKNPQREDARRQRWDWKE